jgi:hypothetical protein
MENVCLQVTFVIAVCNLHNDLMSDPYTDLTIGTVLAGRLLGEGCVEGRERTGTPAGNARRIQGPQPLYCKPHLHQVQHCRHCQLPRLVGSVWQFIYLPVLSVGEGGLHNLG